MLFILAAFIRHTIQMVITLGLIKLAELVLFPLLNRTIEEVAKAFGVDEETAKDIAANEFLIFAEQVGVGILALKTKLPTIIAERLGFTSKGFSLRKLPTELETRVRAQRAGIQLPRGGTTAKLTPTAAEVARNTGQRIQDISRIATAITAIVGLPFVAAIALGQWVDFGNWNSGAYQKRMQRVLAKVTFGLLVPDPEYAKARVTSPEVFDKVWNAYKLEGAVGINDPYKLQSVPFTRENFIELVDTLGAKLLLDNKTVSAKAVIAATQTLMVFAPETGREPSAGEALAAGVAIPRPTARAPGGTIAQGTFGAEIPLEFAQAEMIKDFASLASLAREALFAFWRALPGGVVFDIKLQTSYIDKRGIRRVAGRQTQQVSVSATGEPRFKTLVNRFAVIDIYALTAPGKRVKIDQVVLGPTDAFGLTTGVTEFAALESELREQVAEIPALPEVPELPAPAAPPAVAAPPAAAPVAPPVIAPVGETTFFVEPERLEFIMRTGATSGLIFNELIELRNGVWVRSRDGARVITSQLPAVPPAAPPAAPAAPKLNQISPRVVFVNVDVLMVRSGPATSFPLAGTQRLVRGNNFTVVGWVEGENVSGENRWWLSQFGNYVWVGGTTQKPF